MLDSLIVEANIIFSALIKQSHNFRLIFILNEAGVSLYTPDFVFEEIKKREEKILKFSRLNTNKFRFILNKLFGVIMTISKSEYASFLAEAKQIFPGHLKDCPYFALALKKKSPLWSNEKLHKHQSKVRVYFTSELIELIR